MSTRRPTRQQHRVRIIAIVLVLALIGGLAVIAIYSSGAP
jgi:hypothetical protein